MIPDAYCAERVRAAGGDPELVVRFAPAASRAGLVALAALRVELEHLVEQQHERAVAVAKLAWWHGEIEALGAGEARHPATRALRETLPDSAALAGAMLRFCIGLAPELGGRVELEPAAWRALITARSSWLHALAASARPQGRAATGGAPPDATALDALGAAVAELELLATLGRRLGAARPAFDSGWGVAHQAFMDRSNDALDLVSTRAQVAGATLATHRSAASSSTPIAIVCALAARRARRLAAQPALAWTREPYPSLGALFTAWRAAL